MRKFVQNFIFFISIFLSVIVLGIILPTTPKASKSLLMSAVRKEYLLQNTSSPRIIFVGGSNLSFGLNSKTIKDSLGLNPINTAIQSSIGLKYMMDNTIQYVKKGDIIVLVPEYRHFYMKANIVSNALFRTIFDVNLSKIRLLDICQIINLIPYMPKYASTKFNVIEYGICERK